MADPLSVTSSIIAIATLAYSSAKALHETISSIRDAPEVFVYLKTDVETLCKTIHSLQQEVGKKATDAAFSNAQISNLREIEPALQACRSACDDFSGKVNGLTRHSKDGNTSLRDRFMLQFHDKDIRAFQALLGSYKSTLAIALEFCTFKTSSENLDATRNLETKIEDLTARLTGQMQGLQIGLQTFLDSSATGHKSIIADDQRKLAEAQESRVLQAIEQRNTALKHCYRACMAVFKETTNVTGHTYKYMTASEESKFLMGDLGNVQGGAKHTYEKINATGKAWVVTGNMDGASAANFFK